jgi:hypothetical protein
MKRVLKSFLSLLKIMLFFPVKSISFVIKQAGVAIVLPAVKHFAAGGHR